MSPEAFDGLPNSLSMNLNCPAPKLPLKQAGRDWASSLRDQHISDVSEGLAHLSSMFSAIAEVRASGEGLDQLNAEHALWTRAEKMIARVIELAPRNPEFIHMQRQIAAARDEVMARVTLIVGAVLKQMGKL
ncbi:hypothetical protein [Trinickia mobilis]|uniref:hypothetical protein n=1 Tax=Trinickia mobilis TaxID=2816356 RepID=UPI001A8CDCA5|nr:hypothetical protein [Trinickia mobilis]